MWTDTAATRLLKIRYPIVQGPFGGGSSSVELAASRFDHGGCDHDAFQWRTGTCNFVAHFTFLQPRT